MGNLFKDINFDDIQGCTILLDVDGTLVSDGMREVDVHTRENVARLSISNKVFLCSNKHDVVRDAALAHALGVERLQFFIMKPFVPSAAQLPSGRPLVVIGDKYVTDGLWAKRLGARFIKTDHVVSSSESWRVRLVYGIDNFVSSCIVHHD